MRVALGLEYHGGAFHGWQRQVDVPSVQSDVERALSRVADHPVSVVAAGRTDRGVHATAQVASFETSSKRPMKAWRLGTNSHTSREVKVLWAREVADDFHARYSAVARRYTYLYLMRNDASPLLNGLATPSSHLDADAMHRAAQALVGEQDFSSFRAAGCQSASAQRRVNYLRVHRQGPFAVLEVEANAFVLHMVRNMAGALALVGSGERHEGWVGELLRARDRRVAGPTAPSQGLYLTGVTYPGMDFPQPHLPPPLAALER
ncbi:MAG: tRNA pseudouridine(38-40) synthase TruA [Pseudomonadales bacterium]|jgi:tRNA pseudouridine38-40 synthase|nr:tRNA pseudouridine(38-40) synthase TruA [Pseudomonadales bacterium]MDP6473147.1 tRNA pseudouridine(38-40) synthase TruA [Pseudomonadales bacterium]MDP6826096.1 tRNA pseudouridine(38-40) synthase TruA [Pseudomonadales bacterium]MDP6970371.1 tRNA pseudouridine(38-40) synthase TruA [Pseudomonadales bacterium]